jgi:hypothetical protein
MPCWATATGKTPDLDNPATELTIGSNGRQRPLRDPTPAVDADEIATGHRTPVVDVQMIVGTITFPPVQPERRLPRRRRRRDPHPSATASADSCGSVFRERRDVLPGYGGREAGLADGCFTPGQRLDAVRSPSACYAEPWEQANLGAETTIRQRFGCALGGPAVIKQLSGRRRLVIRTAVLVLESGTYVEGRVLRRTTAAVGAQGRRGSWTERLTATRLVTGLPRVPGVGLANAGRPSWHRSRAPSLTLRLSDVSSRLFHRKPTRVIRRHFEASSSGGVEHANQASLIGPSD